MYIVIAGGGTLGAGLASRLTEARHDVVVVDRDREACEHISSRIGALAIHGLATSIDTLEDAGIRKADVAVGAMPSDADNLAFGLLAKNFGVPRVMARMRNKKYESAYKLAGIQRPLSVSELFVRQVALEIEQPTICHVATFGDGKATIVVVTIPEGSRVDKKAVREIAQDKHFPQECVIAGILRAATDEFVFPRGAAEIHSGDEVFLVADDENVRRAAQFLMRAR